MEIKTYNAIEFRIIDDESFYSFVVPHGTNLDKAIDASSALLNGLINLKKEHESVKEEMGKESTND